MVQYHGPYVDSSGEQFYLPKKWHRFGDDQWKECDVNYSFKKNEMNGGDLIRNLRWLGNSGHLISKLMNEETPCNDDSNDDDDDEADGGLIGCGPPRNSFEEDRHIRRALPEMHSMLSNWTLHGQNLGKMLRNYRRQYRQLSSDHRRELGQFFNTTSAVLDTIGNMTENSILRSVEFDKDSNKIGSGINNAPQPKLPPTDINISRYVAFFPDYQLDNGHIVKPNPTLDIFSTDYPPVPDTQKLRENPNLPVHDKEYSTDDNSTTDESIDFSSSDEENNSDNSEQSYM